jgi:lantibiotic biosynthesis protein
LSRRFCANSVFAAKLLARRTTFDSNVLQIFVLDQLLELLGLTEERRTSWVRPFADLKPEDGIVYREKRNTLVATLTNAPTGFLLEVARMLEWLKQPLAEVSDAIKRAELSRRLTQPAASIIRSMVHMHCNRVWGLDNEHELALLRLFRRTREQIAVFSSRTSTNPQ